MSAPRLVEHQLAGGEEVQALPPAPHRRLGADAQETVRMMAIHMTGWALQANGEAAVSPGYDSESLSESLSESS